MAWVAIQCVLVAAQLHLEWLWAASDCMGETLSWVSQARTGLPLCPSPFPTLGSLTCLRWDVDLVIISEISALKT